MTHTTCETESATFDSNSWDGTDGNTSPVELDLTVEFPSLPPWDDFTIETSFTNNGPIW